MNQFSSTQFEKFTNQTTSINFNLVFAYKGLRYKKKQADLIIYKNGGLVSENSLSIPSYYVCVNKHDLNHFDNSRVITKQFNDFGQAMQLYNDLLKKYNDAGFSSSNVDIQNVKQFWLGYFEKSVTFRTNGVSDRLIDNIVYAISDVVDKIAINYIQQFKSQLVSIIEMLGTAKRGLRDITNKTTYQSSEKIFNNCFNKWITLSKQLTEKNPVFDNVYVSICDRQSVDKVTQAFRLYSNYSDRYK